jgi:hypothetical protein
MLVLWPSRLIDRLAIGEGTVRFLLIMRVDHSFASIFVTISLNRRAGVMLNSLAASAVAPRSSGASTVPRCLPPLPM